MRNFLLGGVASLALVGAIVLVAAPTADLKAASSDTYRQLNLFGDVFERVRSDYVRPTQDAQLVEAAINGMLTSLDPHSAFLSEKSYRDMQVQTRGEFGGLGIEVTMDNGLVKVVAPIDDTPASRAGVKPGDLITHIDGQQVLGLTLQEAVERMRGPINSTINLTIQRQGAGASAPDQTLDIVLTRATIRVQAVRARREGDVGYVKISTFSEQTAEGVRREIENLKQQIGPAKVQGFIIDLRNNPGGLLDQSIRVSDLFLNQGEIVSTRGKKSNDAQRYNAQRGDVTEGRPIVVLINGGSASASEIVAGALQDHKRAVVLGTKSFGKGSVQTIFPLQGGKTAVRLTTALYYTPAGRSIQEQGIEPDINVPVAKVEVVETGPRRSEADLRNHLANPNGPRTENSQAATGAVEDFQLQRALDLLRGVSIFAQQQQRPTAN